MKPNDTETQSHTDAPREKKCQRGEKKNETESNNTRLRRRRKTRRRRRRRKHKMRKTRRRSDLGRKESTNIHGILR